MVEQQPLHEYEIGRIRNVCRNDNIYLHNQKLGYSPTEMEAIVNYCKGYATFNGAPYINTHALKEKGFTDEILQKVERVAEFF